MSDRRAADSRPVLNGKRSGDPVTRRTFLIGGAIIGVALAFMLGAVVWIAVTVNDLQQAEIARNAHDIARLDRVTNGLRKLTHPTPAEYRDQLRSGFRRCAREPSCSVILRRLIRPTRRTSTQTVPGSGPGSPVTGRERTGGSAPRRGRRPIAAGPSPGSPQSSGNRPPEPPASITVPLPASVCTNLLRVNCP